MRKVTCASSLWHRWTWKGANRWFKNSSKEKMNPQLLFWLHWSQRGLFHFCFGTWHCYGPGDAGAAQKGQVLQLAPAQNGRTEVEVLMLVPSHQTRGTASAHEASCGSPAAKSDPLKMLWELHPKQWPPKADVRAPMWSPKATVRAPP